MHRFDLRDDGLESLAAGDRVEFTVVEREKGPRAERLTRLPPVLIAVTIAVRARPILRAGE